jgi:ABC-type Na+ efflux pump permease subunit
MNNYKKYLPSKKFVAVIVLIIAIIAIFFTIKGVISLFHGKNKAAKNAPIPITVGEVIQKDSNYNGIADWEEYLWGLDPTINGSENKAFINSKKSVLAQSGGITKPSDDSQATTENETLSQEFFAAIVSLQQSGNLNEESLKSISDSIGQKAVATPLPDIYTMPDIKIVPDSTTANTTYYNAYHSLITKYASSDMGSELTLISQGIGNNDPQALYAARTVGQAYVSFAEEFVKIPVPSSLSTTHLRMANDYNKMGQSIGGLTVILTEPLLGMRALLNYKQYSDELVTGINKLAEVLK